MTCSESHQMLAWHGSPTAPSCSLVYGSDKMSRKVSSLVSELLRYTLCPHPQVNLAQRSVYALLSLKPHPCAELVFVHSNPRPHIPICYCSSLYPELSHKLAPKTTQHLVLPPPSSSTSSDQTFISLIWEPLLHTCDTWLGSADRMGIEFLFTNKNY